MLTRILIWTCRVGVGAAVVASTAKLTHTFGPLTALLTTVAAVGALCGGAALLLRLQPIGRVSPMNYVAAVALPFGYRMGRGKLPVIVLASWGGWAMVAVATVMALAVRSVAPAKQAGGSGVVNALLVIVWLIDGLALLAVLKVLVRLLKNPGQPAKSILRLCAALVGMIVGSAGLWASGHPSVALLVAGGPVAFVALGYGLFIAVMLIAKPKWN